MSCSLEPKKTRALLLCLVVLICWLSLYFVKAAEPQGATIVGTPSVDTGPNRTPNNRSDLGGRIITLNLNLEQQDFGWKAYVGNVTGTYILQNSNNKSIYEWPLGTSITGEVYISRNSSVNWTVGAITCASNDEMITEQGIFGMSNSATDNINNTFNSTNHTSFNVGSNGINQNTCRAIALWVNDSVQTPSPSAVFQEVTLHDGGNLVYASLINNDQTGFDNTTRYDFQAIIAENRTAQSGTMYYFYLELGS